MRLLSLLLAALLAAAAAQAEVYRCRDASGSLVYTDDPATVAGDCEAVSAAGDGGLNVVPMKAPSVGGEARELIRQRQARREQRQERFEQWQTRARQLADDYRDALRQRYHPVRRTQANKSEAIRKMDRIRKEKAALLEEVKQAEPDADRRQAIERILQDIPVPE